MKGRIHSIESMGAHDGPGLRCVVFLQGCTLRCRYCQNPDTWVRDAGKEVDHAQVVDRVSRLRPYFKSGGGITLSGGEPLLQGRFAGAILAECRAMGINTAVDTCGDVLDDAAKEALGYADLILLDLKHPDPVKYKRLTGGDLSNPVAMLEFAGQNGIPVWIRHVVVPGWNDTREHLLALAELLVLHPPPGRIELIPYHRLGEEKYAALGIRYRMGRVPEADKATLERAAWWLGPLVEPRGTTVEIR